MTAFSFQASAGKLVECDSEFDVLACEGALGVRGEDARHLVPSDVDVAATNCRDRFGFFSRLNGHTVVPSQGIKEGQATLICDLKK